MAENRDILFRFLGDARDLGRATKGAGKDLDSVERKSSLAAQGFGRMKGAIGGFAAAYGAAEVGQFVWDTAQLGARATEAAENLERQLGPAAAEVRDRFEETRYAMGLTAGEMDAMAARYALATENLGLTNEAQAEFVGDLIEAGAELAAYNGELENTPDFVDKVAAATRGEKDALEELIGPLSDAAVETEILRLKTDPATAALSDEAIEMLAVNNVIRQQLAPAFGSLSAAQDTSETKTREQLTKYEELREELGQKLEPVLNEVLEFLIDILDAVVGFTETPLAATIGDWIKKFIEWGGVIAPVVQFFRAIWELLGYINERLQNFVEWIKRIPSSIPNPFSGISVPSWIPGFQTGGTVPGPKGAPRLAVVHGGEQITNPRLGQGTGGGLTVNVTAGVGDPQQIAREIIRVLQTYEQTHGALPFTTRGSV